MRTAIPGLAAFLIATFLAGSAPGQAPVKAEAKRLVLVELFTSQGCDMCPTAEEILGAIGGASSRVAPIAFHVDYFNDPWVDPFSDALYSQRQSVYNRLYKGPKNAEYGLYYTPMLMIDGREPVNGRDRPAAEAAIRRAIERAPQVTIDATLRLKEGGRAGAVEIAVPWRAKAVEGKEVLVAAVLREDGVVTRVPSGENAGKTLVARYPARRSRYKTLTLDGPADRPIATFPFELDPTWDTRRLRLAVFVQDVKTGAIHQAVDLPWTARDGKP